MKKLRIWLLAAICLVTLVGCLTSRAANTDEIADGDVVKIGSYPQTRVTSSSLINTLNGVSKTWKNYPYYSKNSNGGNYLTKLDKTMMDYADFTYNGVKYRAVRINKYRPGDVRKIPDNLSDARQQANGYIKGTVYYFVWEPIEWVVLDYRNGIVQSKKVLDAQPFNAFFEEKGIRYMSTQEPDSSAAAWSYSTLRYWLNGDGDYYEDYNNFNFYYSAFSSSERSAIKSQRREYSVELKAYLCYDSVFLPTETEFIKYKSVITSAQNTDYAEAQGKSKAANGTGNCWYTIKAVNSKKMYYCIDQEMDTSVEANSFITSTITGIRPMLKLDLSSDAVIGPFTIQESSILYRCPHLSWDEQTDAQSYDVYRCPGDVNPATTTAWTKLTTTALDGTATYYTDNTAVTENSYYYYVRKYTSSGSENSKPVKGYCKLYTPTVSVSNNADGKPVLNWTSVDKADGYLVYRKTINESTGSWTSWTKLVTDPLTSRTFTDTTAQAGKEYGYWVRSYSDLGSSYYSIYKWGSGNRASCKLGTPQPTVADDNGKPRISWPRVAGDANDQKTIYTVYYRASDSDNWANKWNSYETSYRHGSASEQAVCQYYVVASNEEMGDDYRSEASAVVFWSAKPKIIVSPHDMSGYVDDIVEFTVSGTGMGVYYTWEYSTNNGSTWKTWQAVGGSVLSVTVKESRNGYLFRCIIQNETGASDTSSAARLTVVPKITTQPKTVYKVAGEKAAFSVQATGVGVSYQWQYRASSSGTWHNCTSATAGYNTASLTVSATTGRHSYRYRCIATDAEGHTAVSSAATLNVLGIKKQPSTVSTTAGKTASFTVTATGAGKTYQWQYRTSSSGTWHNSTSATTGYNKATLKVSATTGRHGYQYRCKVTDSAGNTVTSKAATLNVLGIKTQPSSVSTSAGKTATFKVVATGVGKTYQWQYRTSSSGTWKDCTSTTEGYNTATLKVVAKAYRNGYQYRCKVSDSAGNTVNSKAATLTVK